MKRCAFDASLALLGLTPPEGLHAQTRTWLPDPAKEEAFMQVFHSISSHEVLGYVEALASPRYAGRLSGTPGYMEAAQWVADQLAGWGIRPAGDGGTWFQWFDMPYSVVLDAGALSVEMGSGDDRMVLDYSFPDDYYPGSNSDAGTVTGEAVYVGHGITAPELGYDDYAGVDVRWRIVVIDAGVPYVGSNQDTTVAWVPYSYHQFKLDNAARHGAAGLLYIGKTANPNTSFNPGLVYCHIDVHVADHLFHGTGTTHQAVVEKMQAGLRPSSMALGKRATITAHVERHAEGRAANVVGLLEGSDPVLKDEVIVVGGHLDHVGWLGAPFPGALDNASGIADILGAARALAQSPVPLARSILFLFIGGEESGLLGSTHYTLHPVFPREKTVVFFNLDMVGHGTGLSVGGGLTYPDVYRHFEAANAAYLHRPLRTSESRPSVGRPRSDSVIFQRAGFRTMSFGTTGQVSGISTYYHDPRDTPDTLTPEIMEDVARLMFVGLTGLANDRGLGR